MTLTVLKEKYGLNINFLYHYTVDTGLQFYCVIVEPKVCE